MSTRSDVFVCGTQTTISDVLRALHFIRGRVSVVCPQAALAPVLQFAGMLPPLPPLWQKECWDCRDAVLCLVLCGFQEI